MTTDDVVVIERALVFMAVFMGIQTLITVGAALGAFFAYRNARAAIDEKVIELQGHINEVKAHIDRISNTVDDAVSAVMRGTTAVNEVVEDARHAIGTVRNGVASVASVATAPKTAMALGVIRGVQWWRRRRATERRLAAVGPDLGI